MNITHEIPPNIVRLHTSTADYQSPCRKSAPINNIVFGAYRVQVKINCNENVCYYYFVRRFES